VNGSSHDPTFRESDTLDSQNQLFRNSSSRIPCLTVIFHPQLTRIGELAFLPALMAFKPTYISRNVPVFAQPGMQAQPLRDPFVSRRPVTIERVDDDYLSITPASGVHLEVDNQKITTSKSIRIADLSNGVLLVLSRRIVLLLHLINLHDRSPLPGMIGESEGVRDVRSQIARVADLDVSVLIRGETGVGKELVARSIHQASSRSNAPYRAVNMATIQDGTAASVLFGHMRGAFTGAESSQPGLFQEADGGTLFLDEVGDTKPQIQPMLLRALSEGLILPIGATKESRVNVRIIAATDANIEDDALHHRLNGFGILVPPLRKRREDIPRLVLHFLDQVLTDINERAWLMPPATERLMWFPPALMLRFYHHDWPGNVRQLWNVVRQLVISNRGMGALKLDDQTQRVLEERPRLAPTNPPAPPEIEPQRTEPPSPRTEAPRHVEVPAQAAVSRRRSSRDVSDDEIYQALEQHDWRVGPAAKSLGIPRTTFYDRMDRHPHLRKAVEIPRAEIEQALTLWRGDAKHVAQSLRVSPRGLRLRLSALDIDPSRYK
jgi:two-component system nitrogen regulation response regulator GlnG